MQYPDKIEVTIPCQEWDKNKYIGLKQPCYLEKALLKMGYDDVRVSGWGYTWFNKTKINRKPVEFYKPLNYFDSDIVQKAFKKGEDIHVVLIKQ